MYCGQVVVQSANHLAHCAVLEFMREENDDVLQSRREHLTSDVPSIEMKRYKRLC